MQTNKKYGAVHKREQDTQKLVAIIGGDGQASRCRKRSKNKTRSSSREFDRNGFLNYSFNPLFVDKFGIINNKRNAEEQFFLSVDYFCSLYKLQKPEIEDLYPINLINTYNELSQNLVQINKDLQLLIVETGCNKYSLATLKQFNTGWTLYYIPVRPLFDLIQTGKSKPTANLLISIFTYLYECVKVPWFHNSSSYISNTYECLAEWYVSSDEPESVIEALEELRQIDTHAPGILKIIDKKENLAKFRERLIKYHPKNKWQRNLALIAKEFLELFEKYSYKSLNDDIPNKIPYSDKDDLVPCDGYLSFFWDANGATNNDLMEHVNSSFQEYIAVDEPSSLQVFESLQKMSTHEMEFETRLFVALENLCEVINQIE